jgi:hypothetical protein
VDVRRTWLKLTFLLCTSDGRIFAITGGLLGQTELVMECGEADERRIEL